LEIVHEVLGVAAEARFPWHAALDDHAVALHRVLRHEGRLAGETLVRQDADAPG
jgi:hypothetical protein